MTDADGLRSVKVGVVLRGSPDSIGEWLADGTAFEAAGADVLWVDHGPEPELDPLVLTAALAALTFRSLLVTTLPASGTPSEALSRMLATLGRLSHDRLRVLAPGHPEAFEYAHEGDAPDRWLTVPCPDSRSAWRETLRDAAERGYTGLLVPADPRLLDILRNPDEPGERRDLQLAQG